MNNDFKYWLVVFDYETWKEFNSIGQNIFGFPLSRKVSVSKIKKDDTLICYMSKLSRFIALYKVTKVLYYDTEKIWSKSVYPLRLKAEPIIVLEPETAVQLYTLKDELDFIKNSKTPTGWTYKVRTSPNYWTFNEGEIVSKAIKLAALHPAPVAIDVKNPIIKNI